MNTMSVPIIRIDMTVGDESARIVKIKHQSFEETVRVLNRVLQKMNADVKIELVPLGIEQGDERPQPQWEAIW